MTASNIPVCVPGVGDAVAEVLFALLLRDRMTIECKTGRSLASSTEYKHVPAGNVAEGISAVERARRRLSFITNVAQERSEHVALCHHPYRQTKATILVIINDIPITTAMHMCYSTSYCPGKLTTVPLGPKGPLSNPCSCQVRISLQSRGSNP